MSSWCSSTGLEPAQETSEMRKLRLLLQWLEEEFERQGVTILYDGQGPQLRFEFWAALPWEFYRLYMLTHGRLQ